LKNLRGTLPAHLAQPVARLRWLEQALRACLPADCAAHCRVAGVDGETLVLIADSPAWRARLQFCVGEIISHFNSLGKPPIRHVRVRVGQRLDIQAPAVAASPALQMPAASARGFAALARETTDVELKRALERLARRGAE